MALYWISRDKIDGGEPTAVDIFSKRPLRQTRHGKDIIFLGVQWVSGICYRIWSSAGGLALRPGQGPILVDLTLTCTLVEAQAKKEGTKR